MINNLKDIKGAISKTGNYLRKLSLKAALLLLCSFCFMYSGTAGGDGGVEETQHAKPMTGTIATDHSLPLMENLYSVIDYADFPLPSTQQNKKIKNVITFSINEESEKFIPQDFTATATVEIRYGHDASSSTTLIQTFTVDYKKAEGAKYNARQYFYFDNAEYVKITLQDIDAPVLGGLNTSDILTLENEMHITRYFELSNNVPAPVSFNYTTPDDPVPDHLTVHWEWPFNTGNNATQLEWSWIENELQTNYYTSNTLDYDRVFKNCTRVDLPYNKNNYDIPLLYDGTGKLYYRIRAVNFKKSGTRSEGPWNLGNTFAFGGHNNDLNWQASTSFAEDGKRKSVIQYFDGSLRNRQTVTKDNSTNTVTTAETFYDRQGRPAVQILPTPGINDVIRYQAGLNLFNGQVSGQDPSELFDLQPETTPNSLTPPLLTSGGSSRYYSPANTAGQANIPNAEGYPYTITRYTPDATGRVMAQSGVGMAHKMGSGHETKYYYGGASQEELDGLFGTEAGNFTHYQKNMVRDANGQMSVSYVDMQGRTVATALAGDAPDNLTALDITNNTHYPNQAGTFITRNLLDNSSNVIKNNTIESVNSLVVPARELYNFTYELTPEILQTAACEGANPATVCYDCLYDLEISITDESGETSPIVYQFSNISLNPDDNCSTPNAQFKNLSNNNTSNVIAISRPLEPGSYSIRKTLTISESSFQKYKELYLTKALCKTQQEIIDSVYNVLLTTSDCGNSTPPTCESCLSVLGSHDTYKANYLISIGLDPNQPVDPAIENDINVFYKQAKANCNKLCDNISQTIPAIREMMLLDMIPNSGQYALSDVFDNKTVAGVHTMYDKYNILTGSQPIYRFPWAADKQTDFYRDAKNNKDVTIYPETPQNFLGTLSSENFAKLFQDSWAASLLPHHPEYDRLVFAETYLTESYNWINNFGQAHYDPVQNAQYLNPLSNDPFFLQAPDYQSLMLNQFGNYQTSGYGIWQLAYGDVKCKSISNEELRTNCYHLAENHPPPYNGFTPAENEQAWKIFRGLYAAVRNEMVNKYIAESRPLPYGDEDALVNQKFILWFPKSNQQSAAQNHWKWWPDEVGEPPKGEGTGGGAAAAEAEPGARCASYISRWETELLQCAALASHPSKDAILSAITTRMQAVCVNGSNAANSYGSSTVDPKTPASVTDRSFEDVIKNVFIQYGIINANGEYADAFCNPFVIEWPKPYGKNPKMINGEIISQVDECNCSQYLSIKAEAVAQNVDVNNLTDFNVFLLAKYRETLSPELYTALEQHCGVTLSPQCVCYDLSDVVSEFNQQYPNGVDPCLAFYPSDLQVVNRINNTPAEYVGSTSITLLPGFESGLSDEFTIFISSGCSPVASCQTVFTSFYNTRHNLNPPLTWPEIEMTYMLNCGHGPDICGYKDYTCNKLFDVVCSYRSSHTIPTTGCQQQFADYFNNYYQNTPALSFSQIQAKYNACDYTNLVDMVCSSTPLSGCGGQTTSATDCPKLPYVLPSPVLLPGFIKCGYVANPPCLSCADLSSLTAEYKSAFVSPANASPIFTGTNLTPAEMAYNQSYARFINYRTGYQFGWLEYAQAASKAAPVCNLAAYANNGSAQQNVICGSASPLAANVPLPAEAPCTKVYTMSVALAQDIYIKRQQHLLRQFEEAYLQKCLGARDIEQFSVHYKTSEYHYTLYYYDMAGNLVKTVPPRGVHPDFSVSFTNSVKQYRATGDYTATSIVPSHTFATDYRYNSLGQVTAQHTPDAGISRFWYDALGRLAVSQNAQQLVNNKYSYTLYDVLGRITEVGQKPQAANSMSQALSQNPANLNTWINTNGGTKEQITFTVYDLAFPPLITPPTLLSQQNLRNRVSYTATKNLATDVIPAAASFYSYDIHGNVSSLLQDYFDATKNMAGGNSRYKLLTYDYDVLSGKVNQVNYQPGFNDAFYHRYNYDAENRLVSVETSRDEVYRERDAAYDYYKHGPLARTELGKLKVQGMDYSYTLQGWLKGINQTSLDADKDPGLDGTQQSSAARDALSFALHYYDETVTGNNYVDYKPITGSSPFARPGSAANIKSLYNGNIAAMTVNNAGLLKAAASGNNNIPLLYSYGYDQLNRLVNMEAYKGLTAASNQWSAIAVNDYKEAVSYDPNGNIVTYDRNGNATRLAMDKLTYIYTTNTNQLDKVVDIAPDVSGEPDIKTNQINGNYTYDHIGNLIADDAEGITGINWSVYGKILSITKNSGSISYTYDAAGNRISKTAAGKTTVYVRDATGNVISVYESLANSEPVQKENHLYGSSRIGIQTELTIEPASTALSAGFGTAKLQTFTRGEKIFELSNHLGNVMATISDKKIGHDDGNGAIDYYAADVLTANDYYPGGMELPGRIYQAGNYAYGFNGKRKDNEIYGEGNAYDFGARIYDPRIVRLFSLDPLMKKFPDESNYSFASGNPISNIDVDGERVTWWFTLWRHKEFKTVIINLKKTEVFKTIFKRFIQNQDNVVVKPTAGGYFGFADPVRKANGYELDLGGNGFMNGNYLTADPTFIAKVILHEGLHDKNGLVHAEGDDANYPTLDRHMKKQATTPGYEGEHEAMAEGNVGYLVKGMKQFDKQNGTTHSGDWYNAMAWFGSLQRATDDWKNMDPATKARYQTIIDNEQNYMGYLDAKATYMTNKTAANKTAMTAAQGKVDWKLFKKTRTK